MKKSKTERGGRAANNASHKLYDTIRARSEIERNKSYSASENNINKRRPHKYEEFLLLLAVCYLVLTRVRQNEAVQEYSIHVEKKNSKTTSHGTTPLEMLCSNIDWLSIPTTELNISITY